MAVACKVCARGDIERERVSERARERERERGEREERGREGEGGSQGGRKESHAYTVLQLAEDKMRKTLGLSVFPAQNSRGHVARSGQVRLAGCQMLRACLCEHERIAFLWAVCLTVID